MPAASPERFAALPSSRGKRLVTRLVRPCRGRGPDLRVPRVRQHPHQRAVVPLGPCADVYGTILGAQILLFAVFGAPRRRSPSAHRWSSIRMRPRYRPNPNRENWRHRYLRYESRFRTWLIVLVALYVGVRIGTAASHRWQTYVMWRNAEPGTAPIPSSTATSPTTSRCCPSTGWSSATSARSWSSAWSSPSSPATCTARSGIRGRGRTGVDARLQGPGLGAARPVPAAQGARRTGWVATAHHVQPRAGDRALLHRRPCHAPGPPSCGRRRRLRAAAVRQRPPRPASADRRGLGVGGMVRRGARPRVGVAVAGLPFREQPSASSLDQQYDRAQPGRDAPGVRPRKRRQHQTYGAGGARTTDSAARAGVVRADPAPRPEPADADLQLQAAVAGLLRVQVDPGHRPLLRSGRDQDVAIAAARAQPLRHLAQHPGPTSTSSTPTGTAWWPRRPTAWMRRRARRTSSTATSRRRTRSRSKQPRIYFGQQLTVVLHRRAAAGSSKNVEFDHPSTNGGSKACTTTYTGSGGVPIGSRFDRLLYAVQLHDPNIFFSSEIESGSQLLTVRDPRARVAKVAPWLTLDGDVYPASGRRTGRVGGRRLHLERDLPGLPAGEPRTGDDQTR